MVNNTQEAEDIMQESFLAAFKKIGSYSGEVSFGAWLKRIVINRSLDALKKKKADLLSIDDTEDLPDTGVNDADAIDASLIEVKKIQRCIKLLPDGYRVILSLYLLEGYDHEEIAGILGISASTSRSQYTRAKQKLAELMKKNHQDG